LRQFDPLAVTGEEEAAVAGLVIENPEDIRL